MTEPTTIYLARHGQTWFNLMEKVQGWSDTPLTPAGVEVVEKLGRGLQNHEFVAAYSSDSGRARETAQIVLAANQVNPGLALQERKEIREACFGDFEGNTDEYMWGRMAEATGYQGIDEMLADNSPTNFQRGMQAIVEMDSLGIAEDFLAVQKRVKETLLEIAEATATAGGGNIFVVSHGMSIAALLADLAGVLKVDIENATITKLNYQAGEFTVETIGSKEFWG